ncbi:hypothetical protein GWI33_013757 [Rhynchophorus ferrugineus]|uniref:Cyclin-like domain-containing protein n=1 Tax=Rhynchophorus ferrugineus TaxID=354439 RepID=A0A834MBA6_RHYFE|nr:hypothetical protein GWI33_013757 [Rhynchophorus ferrugineus]
MSDYKLKEKQVYIVKKLPNMEIHKYTRTLERTPLGNIQDKATKNLTIEPGKKQVQPRNSTTIAKKPVGCNNKCCTARTLVPGKKTTSISNTSSCYNSFSKPQNKLNSTVKTSKPNLSTSRQSINGTKSNQSKNISSASLSDTISSNAASVSSNNQSVLNDTSSSSFNYTAASFRSDRSSILNSIIPPYHTYDTLPSTNYVTLSENSTLSSTRSSSFANSTMYYQNIPKVIRTEPTTVPSRVVVPSKSTHTSKCITLQVNGERQPAVKSTLKRRSSTNRKVVFPLLLSPDYLEDIIAYNHSNKDQLLLDVTWVESYMDRRSRTFMVNWILELTQYALPDFEPALFMAVRIFDYAIMKLKLIKQSYQLAALVSMWLCVKYLGVNTIIKVPKLHMLGSGKYTKGEILAMEISVLQSLNFCFNVPDPLIFLHSYLITAKIEDDETLKYSTMFVMECTTLFDVFSVGDPALLAASALCFAYKVLNKDTTLEIDYRWYQLKDVQSYMGVMAQSVRTVISYNFEPAKKYRTMEKLRVVEYFQNV